MTKLEIRIIPVTPIVQNCCLLSDPETKEAVLIDPGGDVPTLLGALEELGLSLKEIWLTHGHLDHAGGADELREKTGVPVIGPHKADQFLMDSIEEKWAEYGHPGMGRNVTPDRYLEEGEALHFGEIRFDVLHTPGHSPGSLTFYNEDMKLAFVGDVLFKGSVGRTDLPGSDPAALIASITEKLWPLGNEMQFICGHGPASSFGAERESNAFVSDRVLSEG